MKKYTYIIAQTIFIQSKIYLTVISLPSVKIRKMTLIEPFCSFFLYRIPEFHNAFRSLISTRVALTCNKDNPAARRLYEKKGFTATGVEDEDEIELVLNLE